MSFLLPRSKFSHRFVILSEFWRVVCAKASRRICGCSFRDAARDSNVILAPDSHHPGRRTSSALRWQRRLRIRPPVRRHRPSLAHRPRPREGGGLYPHALPARPRSARTRYIYRRHSHRSRADVQLHRAFPRHQARRHRPRLALRDQLPAQEHQLRRRQRRRFHHGPAHGHWRSSPRTGSALSGQEARWLLGLARLFRWRRGHPAVVSLRLHLRQPSSRGQMGPRRHPQSDQGLHPCGYDRR